MYTVCIGGGEGPHSKLLHAKPEGINILSDFKVNIVRYNDYIQMTTHLAGSVVENIASKLIFFIID